jgi:hypothetical protein
MFSTTFWRCESSDYEFLLQTSFDLQPVGSSLSSLIDVRFAFSDYASHPPLLGQLKEGPSFVCHVASQLNAGDRLENVF